MDELKTLKEVYGNKANGQISVKELKAEAIKRVNNCCPVKLPDQFTKEESRCDACERDIWFYELTEEDLK